MADNGIVIINQKEIQESFEAQIPKMETQINKGLLLTGKAGVGILKLNTPVDQSKLVNSMSYTTNNKVIAPLGPLSSTDILNKLSSPKELAIGTNVIYGPWVEFMAKNGSAGFMSRSWKQLKGQAESILKKQLKGGFK